MRIVMRRRQGQAMVEAAIFITFFVILAMGIVEFGRAFFLSNYIANAARDGARMAAVLTYPNNGRNACQKITDFTTVRNQVNQELQAVGLTGMNVNFVQSCATGASAPPDCNAATNCDPGTPPTCNATPAGNIPYVTVCVSGSVNYLFNLPLVGTGFGVNRSATFRDEQR
jgi:Flp pilus assembly protein TadG